MGPVGCLTSRVAVEGFCWFFDIDHGRVSATLAVLRSRLGTVGAKAVGGRVLDTAQGKTC